MLFVVVKVLADFLEHEAAVLVVVSKCDPSEMNVHSFLADRIVRLDDLDSLDVLEAAGVGFGFGEAICVAFALVLC